LSRDPLRCRSLLSLLRLGRKNVLLEVGVVVSDNVSTGFCVLADVDVPLGVGAIFLCTTNLRGSTPNDLSEVPSSLIEAGLIVAVLLFFVVPGGNGGLEVLVTSGQVFSVRSTAVLELTSLNPLVTERSNVRVPSQWRCLMNCTEFVMGIQDGLLLTGQLDFWGLGGRFLAIDGTTFESIVGTRVVRARVREDAHLIVN